MGLVSGNGGQPGFIESPGLFVAGFLTDFGSAAIAGYEAPRLVPGNRLQRAP
jgi:hypothetical protein